MTATAAQYLIQDPYHDYAMRFMQILHRKYGWRAVCMYTNPAGLRMNARDSPQLRSPELVAASYRVSDAGMPAFVEHLLRAHDIRAVVPHFEPSVLPAAHIAAALGLSWAQPDVLWRFRDKYSLKDHLSTVAPELGVNPGRLVSSPAEARDVAAESGMKRYVLKPNDGFGNVDIGMFAADSDPAAIARYWSDAGAGTLLLEEFVGGPEYYVNGQTDAAGNVLVLDVARYVRTALNGRDNLKIGAYQILSNTPLFQQLASYVQRVVQATGLRRNPFHAEVKLDENGPCLIECAARLIGAHGAPTINLAHGESLDVFDLAAHYYATDEPYGSSGADWDAHDRHPYGVACGVVPRTERVYSVTGITSVERIPEFSAWVKKPEVGERLHSTTDIFGAPYIAYLKATGDQDLEPVIRLILDSMRWNTEPRTPVAVATAAAALARRRLRQLPTLWELRMPRYEQ